MNKQIMILLLLFALPLVSANEVRDVEVMSTQTGIEMRFAQLERSIYLNELTATRVLSHIENNYDVDTEELEGLLYELTALRSILSSTETSELTVESAVNLFTDTRRTASEVSREFRELARQILSSTDLEQLRSDTAIREDRQRLAELDEFARQRVREHNAQVYRERLASLDVNQEQIERIRRGELSVEEIRRLASQELLGVQEEQRTRIQSEMNQTRTERRERAEQIQRERVELERERISALRLRAEREAQLARETRASTQMYRIVLSVGETHSTDTLRFTLRDLSERQAHFNVGERTFTLDLAQRTRVGDITLMYYSYLDGRGVFVISPLVLADAGEVRPRPTEEVRPQIRPQERPAEEEVRPTREPETTTTTTTDGGVRR